MSNETGHYWIWPRVSVMSTDGAIRFKTSGIDRNEIHWSSEEQYLPNDADYAAMNWVYLNRNALPPLLERPRVLRGLEAEEALVPPDDGIYFLGAPDSVEGWAAALKLNVSTLTIGEIPTTLRRLTKLTGDNCFLFLDGKCEAALSVGREQAKDRVPPGEALKFIQSIAESERGQRGQSWLFVICR